MECKALAQRGLCGRYSKSIAISLSSSGFHTGLIPWGEGGNVDAFKQHMCMLVHLLGFVHFNEIL